MASSVRESGVSTPELNGSKPTTICVFCGSCPGSSPAHLAAARSLAKALHANSINLVYGGGTVGLMGEVARSLVSLSGPNAVHGIIPEPLIRREQGSDSRPDVNVYGRTTVVPDMHTRKQMMAREVMEGGPGGGFVALSGGYGTLEELMEVVTWNQLGIHARGVVVYNVEGYYDGLMQWLGSAVDAGFVAEGNRGIIVEAKTSDDVVSALREYKPAEGRFDLKWGKQ
ncbi:MAG: hypothetical protein M1817_004556 [Caeruleum heppii]|nr:MAG: hypothetical protein M1817_004556 [Caeruleum heppii]